MTEGRAFPSGYVHKIRGTWRIKAWPHFRNPPTLGGHTECEKLIMVTTEYPPGCARCPRCFP